MKTKDTCKWCRIKDCAECPLFDGVPSYYKKLDDVPRRGSRIA